jgi:hypothetical protein
MTLGKHSVMAFLAFTPVVAFAQPSDDPSDPGQGGQVISGSGPIPLPNYVPPSGTPVIPDPRSPGFWDWTSTDPNCSARTCSPGYIASPVSDYLRSGGFVIEVCCSNTPTPVTYTTGSEITMSFDLSACGCATGVSATHTESVAVTYTLPAAPCHCVRMKVSYPQARVRVWNCMQTVFYVWMLNTQTTTWCSYELDLGGLRTVEPVMFAADCANCAPDSPPAPTPPNTFGHYRTNSIARPYGRSAHFQHQCGFYISSMAIL